MGGVKFKSKGKNAGKNKKPLQKTRKEKRKEKRLQKKQNRKTFNENRSKKNRENINSMKEKQNLVKDVNFGKNKLEDNLQKHAKIKVEKNIIQDKFKAEQEIERRKQKKLELEMDKQRKKQLKVANLEEDRTIHQLEKQLRINKRKNKNIPKSFASDGLDYLLDFCDEGNRKVAVEAEKQLLGVDSGSEFEDDFAVVTGKTLQEDKKKKKKEKTRKQSPTGSEGSSLSSDDENDFSSDNEEFGKLSIKKSQAQNESDNDDDDSFIDSDVEEEEEEDNMQEFPDESGEESDSEDEENFESKKRKLYNHHESDNKKRKKVVEFEDESDHESELEGSNSSCIDEEETDEKVEDEEGKEEKSKLWEDIYGRTRDKDGNVVSNRYVPPAARNKNLEEDSENSKKLFQLKRQLKGPLNRLTDRNMHTISSQIDELYMTNSRNDMNKMLTNLIMEALVAPIMTPDRLIMEHMMLIAVLHANVGSEVGSQFLLTLVKRIEEALALPSEVENKELDNLILMLSHLYNYKVFGSQLIYEILEKLSEKFTEKEIDLILLILKNVGFSLRKDNPLALKELILKLQQKAAVTKYENSRVKFMLDILLAIKNNNMNKIPQYDPSVLEHMKKVLKTLIRKGNGISQLNITLEDLLNVDERGKWWIVGAAWTGSTTLAKKEKTQETKPEYNEKLLELARKQRMNTDTRRSVFCILMSAEDYLDAFEKLQHLSLKDGQEKEIIYVLMNCCLQEKDFNPYYAVLAQKFCDYNRKYQMTIQYTLWDKFKILDTFTNRQLLNLARFLTYLFLHRGLSISTMKVIQLDELDKPKMKLLRQVVLGVLMDENLETCLAVFERITRSDQLKTFREALRLFINQFVLKNVKDKDESDEKATLIKERADLVDKILTVRSSRIVF